MALLLTLIANIGVTSLVGSFRLALTDWLETRLSADFYVTAGVMDAASSKENGCTQLIGAWLQRHRSLVEPRCLSVSILMILIFAPIM